MIVRTQRLNALSPGEMTGKAPPAAPDLPGVGAVRALSAHPLHVCQTEPARFAMLPLRLLIADDYVDAAESLAMLFSHSGVETEIALDGEQALARASRWRPHICVFDINMPGLNGREIARRIREQAWAERPLLIALTGLTGAHDMRDAFDAGFDHFMLKPAEPMKLVRIIQNHLLGRQTCP
jgi:CheY-like chemotaxis protein